jgi:hypothetical protein
VAGVIRQFGPSYIARFGKSMPAAQLKAMQAIESCRTPALGGHVVECNKCRVQEYAYHSCRHRSCPKCQQQQGEEWFEARRLELLPVPYFHVVFTVPEQLRWIIRKHQRRLYPVLIQAVARTLLEVAADPQYMGGTIGLLTVLHTWTRTLVYHPHVHCLVPAGYVDEQGTWHAAKSPYLAPQKVLAKVFRGKLCAMMRAAVQGLQLPGSIFLTPWVVNVDLPKHGTETVLRYLARYVHRAALSDHRIIAVTDKQVVFKYRDKERRKWKTMRLGGNEFLRRFLQHVLPERLHKVRYFGLWSRKSQPLLASIRQQLLAATVPITVPVRVEATPACESRTPSWLKCPHCSAGQRIILARFAPGVPPPPLRPVNRAAAAAQRHARPP